MQLRKWVRSGVEEEFDKKQLALLSLVMENVQRYYDEMYQKKPAYKYPLSLGRLAKLCRRSGSAVAQAVRILANSVGPDEEKPPLFYERVQSRRNGSHRPYRIWLVQSSV